MNSRRGFIIERLKQSAFIFLVLILVVMLVIVPGAYQLLGNTFGYTLLAPISVLAGPCPVFLTLFDISDRLLFRLSCVFVACYWIGIGIVAGLISWRGRVKEEAREIDSSRKALVVELRATISFIVILGGIIFYLDNPLTHYSYQSQSHRSVWNIENNLRQIDAAKEQFALEAQKPGSYVPTEADLTVYIRVVDGRLPHVGPEHYAIGPISNAPYAYLDADWRIPRHGWQEGFLVGTNGTIFRLP